jgi:hypothetical protein
MPNPRPVAGALDRAWRFRMMPEQRGCGPWLAPPGRDSGLCGWSQLHRCGCCPHCVDGSGTATALFLRTLTFQCRTETCCAGAPPVCLAAHRGHAACIRQARAAQNSCVHLLPRVTSRDTSGPLNMWAAFCGAAPRCRRQDRHGLRRPKLRPEPLRCTGLNEGRTVILDSFSTANECHS